MFAGLLLVTLVVAHPDLDEGRVAVSAMKYRPAVAALTKVTLDAAASDAEVVEAFGLLAKAQLGLKKPELAQAAFEGLLQRAPMVEEPPGSPALRKAFQQAKAALFPPGTVRLVKRPSGEDALVAEVINPWRIPLTASWFSLLDEVGPRQVRIEEHRVVVALVPGSVGWLELSSGGNVVAALGSRARPIAGPLAPVVAEGRPPPADAPAKAPALTPERREGTLLPPAPVKAVSPTRRALGWGLVIGGAAATAAGIGLLGGGSVLVDRAENWVFNGLSYEQSERDRATGATLQLVGPIVGGVGLAALISGVLVLLTE